MQLINVDEMVGGGNEHFATLNIIVDQNKDPQWIFQWLLLLVMLVPGIHATLSLL